MDIFLQFVYGKNILGYPEIDGRYGGVFGKEAIAGSYIQKLSMLAILPFFYLKLKKKNNNILIILITIILGAGILMSLDRMPFFIYIFSLMLLLILLKNFRKIISLSI